MSQYSYRTRYSYVDDISNKKDQQQNTAKDAGSAAVATATAIATGMVWIITIFDLLSS